MKTSTSETSTLPTIDTRRSGRRLSSVRVGGGDLQREIRPGDTCKLRGEDQQVRGIGQWWEDQLKNSGRRKTSSGSGNSSASANSRSISPAVLECEHGAWIDLEREVQVERAADLLGMDVHLERLAVSTSR